MSFLIDNSAALRDIALIVLGIFGSYLLWSRTESLRRQSEAAMSQSFTAEQRQKFDYIDKTIEQLNSAKIGDRLYALHKTSEMIDKDSNLKWIIFSLITSFIRERLQHNTEKRERFSSDTTIALVIISEKFSDGWVFDADWQKYIDLKDVNFSGLGMFELTFNQADFANSNFHECQVKRVVFDNCFFSGCDFSRSEFVECVFKRCFFDGAEFIHADFEGSELRECKISNESLRAFKIKPEIFSQ